jgi:hypothetical protein
MPPTVPEPATVVAADPLLLARDVYPWTVSVGFLDWIAGLPAGPPVAAFRERHWMDDSHQIAGLNLLTRRALVGVWVNDTQGSAGSLPPVAATPGDLPVVRLYRRKFAPVPGLDRVQCEYRSPRRSSRAEAVDDHLALRRRLLATALPLVRAV